MNKPPPKPKTDKAKATGAGKATSAGVMFQAQVSAWIAVHVVARKALRPGFGVATESIPSVLRHETSDGIDDLVVQLEPNGRIFLQATTGPTPKKVEAFIRQAALTWLESMAGGKQGEFTTRLDRACDALVLIVPIKARKNLDDLESACRQFDQATLWANAGISRLNAKQAQALSCAQALVSKVYLEVKGQPPTPDQLVEFFAMLRIVRADVANGGQDHTLALTILKQHTLADPTKCHDTWNFLVTNKLEAMKRGRGVDRQGLMMSLQREGHDLRADVDAGEMRVQSTAEGGPQGEALAQFGVVKMASRDEAILQQHADQELKSILTRTRSRINFVDLSTYRREITDIARRCISGDLVRASQALRWKALVFAVRANATDKKTESEAQLFLSAAKAVDGKAPTKLEEITLLALSDTEAAIRHCRQLDQPEARSQLFAWVLKQQGAKSAHDWVLDNNLSPDDFNAVGAVNVVNTAISLDQFEFAHDWVERASESHLSESPALQFTRGLVRFAATVPNDQKSLILSGLPQNLNIFAFAQTPDATEKRSLALADLRSVAALLPALDLPNVEELVSELILWLEILNPESHNSALETLRQQLRDPELIIQRARLSISYGVTFDQPALLTELMKRRKLGGWTVLEASTALLLVMSSGGYKRVAEFVVEQRDELVRTRLLSADELTAIEIEALARDGAHTRAQERFEAARDALPEVITNKLERILSEVTSDDATEAARIDFEQSQGTEELRRYCAALEQKSDYSTLAQFATKLARTTLTLADLRAALSVLQRLGHWRETLNFISELSAVGLQDENILLSKAEALFRIGDINGARSILDQHFNNSAQPGVIRLEIWITIESGDWGHLQGIFDRVKGAIDGFDPLFLAQLARVARDAGSAHSSDLMAEAIKRAGDNPNIYLAAYTLAVENGQESDPNVHEWFRKAEQLSGSDGPIQRKSLQDIVDMAPGWREREDRANNEVRAGNAPLFIAARTLNLAMANAALGRALNNLSNSDASRRSSILAFDGSRQFANLSSAKIVALDLSAILTLGLLGILPKVLSAFDTIVIGAGTLSQLFEERQRIRFHQPSRIAKAKRLKSLIDSKAIKVLDTSSNPPRELSSEVGDDLAGMLVKARQMKALVVQPGPLHKVGSFMDTIADVGDYTEEITDTREVLEFLKARGALTARADKDATAYINHSDKGMPGAKKVTAPVPLFLDDLAVSYLDYTETLVPLTKNAAAVYISEHTAATADALIAYEQQSADLLARIESIRIALSDGLNKGNVIVNERVPSDIQDDDDLRQSPTMALLQSTTPFDVVAVDDKALNRWASWDMAFGRTGTATTIDLIATMADKQVLQPPERDEALRVLRAADYQLIPTDEDELIAMARGALVDAGVIVETQEMLALRENLLSVAATRGLQPREEAWLNSIRLAVLKAIRVVWAEPMTTPAERSTWLLSLLPSLADYIPLPVQPEVWARIRAMEAAETSLFFNSLGVADAIKPTYLDWVTRHIIEPLEVNDPERYEAAVANYKKVIREVADGKIE